MAETEKTGLAAHLPVKRLVLVTCIYDLTKRGSASHRTIGWMLDNAAFVLGQDRELVIFTDPDPELEDALRERRGGRPTKIMAIRLEELLRQDRAAAVMSGTLPLNANPTKDRPSYVQLTWSKFAMLEMALKVTCASHIGWIDFSITHIAKLPPDGVDVFADPPDAPRVHVLCCFGKGDVDHPDYWRYVRSHLAAGLVVGPRGAMHDLVGDFWHAADRAISMRLSPLEEGLLAYVVAQRPGDFLYSYGAYEDILRNHDVLRGGAAHRAWIVADARSRGLPDTMDDLARQTRYMEIVPTALKEAFPAMRAFRPVFSPRSCYLLRDSEEEDYFTKTGGAPEAALIEWATQFIEADQTFIDIGSHVGSWAQHFAQTCKQVHAFEPQRVIYDRLSEGIRLAELNNIVCHDVALGAQGEMDLHHVEKYGGWSTLRHRPELGNVIAVERVRCAQLDDFAFDDVGVIKIDAEGYEIDILRGAAKTIELHRPTLLLEAWDQNWFAKEREELIAYVHSIGYDVVPIRGWPQMLLVEPSRLPKSSEPEEEKASQITQSTALNEALKSISDDLPRSLVVAMQDAADRPLLGLVMIVKNEAKRISEVLASYRPYIDAWTILDTGSTDGTQELIRAELVDLPGSLYEEPFVDFSTSRNRALELHGTSTMFSIMPNGDVLFGGAELRSFLETRRLDRAGSYRVRISPGHYYHPLVMRTGAGWHYKWRTHECAVGLNQGPQIPGVRVNRDRGNRTDAEWRARWERDLILLNLDREDDPSDPRPYFYLGQTHECLGQHAEALTFFERRAEMGGYFDEVYEAKFRIAKMKDELDHPWAEVQQAYLEAYAHDPRRAEPLYEISDYWYDNVHAISRIFAAAAAKTPKPPTDLFLDEEIYEWRAADRAAISSSYSGHIEDARYYGEMAVRAKPDDERIRANRAFYAASARELFGAAVRPIGFSPEPGWNVSNPSIYRYDDRIRCVVRTVNYKVVNGAYVTPPADIVHDEGPWKGWQVIRTRNFLLDLNYDLTTKRSVEMVDVTNTPRTTYPVHGFEDARIFAWKGKWWATTTVCDFTENGAREIALLQIEEDGSVVRAEPLRGPWSDRVQKNWMPFVDGDIARFVYATSPTEIFELIDRGDSRTILRPENGALGHGRLRGGSQGVRVDGGWIFVVHDVAFPDSGRIYLHRFVMLDEKLRLTSMTDPFYFEQRGIEFCAGLAKIDDKLIVSYAVNDGSARLGIFDWQRVRSALRKDFVI